ncbi:MAG: hypothetical protein IPN76_08165 [Saprospiraceae bacterium]|nr:hypothetical protein [Saprospiraceae bacterium]
MLKDIEKDLVLTNGLLLRRWRIAPDVATTHLTLLTNGDNYLRGVKPEAQLVLDGDTVLIITSQAVTSSHRLTRDACKPYRPIQRLSV